MHNAVALGIDSQFASHFAAFAAANGKLRRPSICGITADADALSPLLWAARCESDFLVSKTGREESIAWEKWFLCSAVHLLRRKNWTIETVNSRRGAPLSPLEAPKRGNSVQMINVRTRPTRPLSIRQGNTASEESRNNGKRRSGGKAKG